MKVIKLQISKVEYSRTYKRKVLIPRIVTPELAELDGIIRSDGTVVYGKDHHNDLIIFGDSLEELPFLKYFVKPLIEKVHGKIPIKLNIYPSQKSCVRLEVHSKAIASFWNKVMGIPTNKLDFALNPKILQKRELMIPNIRGYFDGDGCITFSPGTRRFSKNAIKINYYPLIDISTQSRLVATQIERILKLFHFRPFILRHIEEKGGKMRYVVRIGGRNDYEKFVEQIGSNNPVHLTKILIYEIFGHCPPKTTLVDRIEILRGKKLPEEFYPLKPNKIRPLIMKENEEKVLKVLSKGHCYYKEIMEKTGIKDVSSVLKRLEKFNQIRCLGLKKENYPKKFFEITPAGEKRLNRISSLREKLKKQFYLDI